MPPWREFTVVPYDLRHSFATWCRDNGVELHTCVEWMGHTDAQMILKIYDEVSSTRSQIEAEKLEKMLIHRQNDMQNCNQSVENGNT
ncbi:MAG: tyrosine-type recombinase/integrase [Clostridia bacterium]|nr:tyrosine-type recombinase/integrase [Clostridia bacterium]